MKSAHNHNRFHAKFHRNFLQIPLVLLVLALAGTAMQAADTPHANVPWMNTLLSPDRRADLVIQQMTLDEKIQLVHGSMAMHWQELGLKHPIPGALNGDGFVPGIPRLGIPDIQLIGAGVGVTDMGNRTNGESTALPSSLAETATWDPEMARQFGTVIGKETRDQGFNVSLGGGIDLTREPRDGRNFEYHGEDPLLAGEMVGAELKAIQAQGVIADIKHYAVNDQESGRTTVSSNVDKRSLRETDLLAFEIALERSHVGTVMCSYNRVNGVYACENKYLLTDVLKHDWGFQGWVMSDWGATHSTVAAALAGLDQEFFANHYFAAPLKAAVLDGQVPMSRLDDMDHRILRTMFAFGVIDHPPVIRPVDFQFGAKVAQQVEEQGCVLLKNKNHLLPLEASKIHSIAVIGAHANLAVLSGGGSAQVIPQGGNAIPQHPQTWTSPLWDPSSPLAAIRVQASHAKVSYDEGIDPAAAAEIAKSADVAIVFVQQHTHEDADLSTLELPDHQDDLVRVVAAANPRTIVVGETGGPFLMPWIDQVDAVLEAWYPGIRGGPAIAAVLFGVVNPSGKLPITFPKSDADLPHPTLVGPPKPTDKDHPPFFDVSYSEGLKVGYKWYDAEKKQPLFPFGFGLSYTSFSYSQLRIVPNGTADNVRVTFVVKNTGHRAGAEIAEVYLTLPRSAGEPPIRLVGWRKIKLQPGQRDFVTLTVPPRMLAIFNVQKHVWQVLPGRYWISVGSSSRNLPMRRHFDLYDVSGSETLVP
ncbi:MAG TPA: glycoside hydrolase family 3 C-terminal domain-containing protein [Acidobacteriaceae bacterium]|nr:glycoside hydrolase family 3 C-terminal domain-containing protein [Acidobacteriaceae bacterium]